MPTLLRELIAEANNLGANVPTQQSKEKYTMIEDVTIPFENPALKTGSGYTSLSADNNIIDEPQARSKMRLPTYPPKSYQDINQNNFSPNLNVISLTGEGRNQSLYNAQNAFMESAPSKANLLAQPISAAEIPPMNKFVSQPAMPMKIREGFRSRQQGQQSCIDTLNHISNCPMCSRYFECDAKVYHVIIFMLIVLFLTILYFVCKEEHKFKK
jgi:hypothetical protein